MKEEKTGAEVVQAITEQSATFNQMTAFAQEKYVKRKLKRHLGDFRLLRCTPYSIAEALFKTYPYKSLRGDALSNMLTLGNITSDTHVLVADGFRGMLIGALKQRTQHVLAWQYGERLKKHPYYPYFNIPNA
jgi:tRNA (adenine-N(1)-)-methyltransferase non-catalytic subunit